VSRFLESTYRRYSIYYLNLKLLQQSAADAAVDAVLTHLLTDQVLVTADATWGQTHRHCRCTGHHAWGAVHLVGQAEQVTLLSVLGADVHWAQTALVIQIALLTHQLGQEPD